MLKATPLRARASRLASSAAAAFALAVGAPAVAQVDTGFTGGNQAFDNHQPSLGINYIVSTQGTFEELGEVAMFGGNFAPSGWALAQGQLLSISQNSALFSKLGTTYGGDGESTFALPDLRGRTPIGTGAGPGLNNVALGQRGGTQSIALTNAMLPAHTHTQPFGPDTSSTGANAAFSSRQPYLGLNFAITDQGRFPSRSAPTDGSNDPLGVPRSGAEPYLAGLRMFAGTGSKPTNAVPAQGQILDIATNTAVFSLMGTTYGGDGESTFGLPDLRGRSPIQYGNGPGLPQQNWGARHGSEITTLSANQLPPHNHAVDLGQFTGNAGGNQPFDLRDPTLGLAYVIALTGVFPSENIQGDGTAGGSDDPQPLTTEPMIGEIGLFAGNFAPRGWALAEGQLLDIASNTALFSIYGTTYGGDGETTFALPDLRGRVALGAGTGPGLAGVGLGQRFGAHQHTLTVGQLPSHNHTYVPEPASAALLLLAGTLTLTRRRRA